MKIRCPDPVCAALVTNPVRGTGRITSKPVWLCPECSGQLPRISEIKSTQGASA